MLRPQRMPEPFRGDARLSISWSTGNAAESLDFARDDEETRGLDPIDTAASSPVHFARSAMKPFYGFCPERGV